MKTFWIRDKIRDGKGNWREDIERKEEGRYPNLSFVTTLGEGESYFKRGGRWKRIWTGRKT